MRERRLSCCCCGAALQRFTLIMVCSLHAAPNTSNVKLHPVLGHPGILSTHTVLRRKGLHDVHVLQPHVHCSDVSMRTQPLQQCQPVVSFV